MTEEKKSKIMNLKLLWYCTKSDLKLYKTRDGDYTTMKAKDNIFGYEELNEKIVVESDFDCEEINHGYGEYGEYYQTKTLGLMSLREHSCISSDKLSNYLKRGNEVSKVGYAIHIKNLYKFIKPKELKDLYVKGGYHNAEQMFTDEIQINGEWFHPMKRAPQNMCYVYDKDGVKYVLISTHPEWLCLILNGLKDVELRRKVLKEML